MEATQSAYTQDYYISLLERTNQQFNYWNSQNTIAVSFLSILFTAMAVVVALIAIAVAYAIWKNSKEQREQAVEFFREQERIIEKTNKDNKKRVMSYEKKLDALISGYSDQLKSADKENKKIIEQAIDDLKKERAGLGLYVSSPSVSPSASGFATGSAQASGVSGVGSVGWEPFGSYPEVRKCKKCGALFNAYPTLSGVVICPQGHAQD